MEIFKIHWVVEQDVPFALGDGVKFHTVSQDLFDIAVVAAAVGLAWDNLVHSSMEPEEEPPLVGSCNLWICSVSQKSNELLVEALVAWSLELDQPNYC